MYKEINEVEERIKQLEETIEYSENKDKQFDAS
jgi:hypothetical protein